VSLSPEAARLADELSEELGRAEAKIVAAWGHREVRVPCDRGWLVLGRRPGEGPRLFHQDISGALKPIKDAPLHVRVAASDALEALYANVLRLTKNGALASAVERARAFVGDDR
jgi:hypothetical protein